MAFECDPAKSQANLEKHGVDFKAAQALWRDYDRVQVKSAHPGEERHLMIGMINEKLWTVVFVHRDESLRIISARRARAVERNVYYGQA